MLGSAAKSALRLFGPEAVLRSAEVALSFAEGDERIDDRMRLHAVDPGLVHGGRAHADIIWIHGLGGDSRTTWSHESFFWPADIARRLAPLVVRPISYGYPADISRFGSGGQFRIKDQGRFFAQALHAAGVGERPYMLICHSLGGLVAKHAILHCQSLVADGQASFHGLATNLCAIVFFAVPHHGSRIAEVVDQIQALIGLRLGAEVVHELRREYRDDDLVTLDDEFRRYRDAHDVRVRCFVESSKLPLINNYVVDPLSGRGEYARDLTQLPGDHFSVAKLSRDSAWLHNLSEDIREWLMSVLARHASGALPDPSPLGTFELSTLDGARATTVRDAEALLGALSTGKIEDGLRSDSIMAAPLAILGFALLVLIVVLVQVF